MKRFFIVALSLSFLLGGAIKANAEGYQINSQSARQLGMGYTGVALKLGAESMNYNPAGMAYMNTKFNFSFGGTGVFSKVKYTKDDYSAKTDNPVGTPFFVYMGYKPSKNLAVGVSINNPVGNSLKWPSNWRGATLIEDIKLKGFSVQPTVSYKFGDIVSVGAGLMIDFGSFSLSRALLPVGGLDQIAVLVPSLKPAIESFNGQVPLSVNLSGRSKIGLGYNVGVLVNVSPKVSIGASYRSKVMFNVSGGEAELSYANEQVKKVISAINAAKPGTVPIPPLEDGSFEASLPAPANFNIGLAYKPLKNLTLSAELQYVGWKAYDTLTVQFDERVLQGYSIKAPKSYKNTMIYRLGCEYILSSLTILRLGAYYDTTPVQEDLYNPETPGSNKFCITAGASFKPLKYMSIDLGLGYLNGAKTYGSYPMPSTVNSSAVFDGNYKASAFMASLGLNFSF